MLWELLLLLYPSIYSLPKKKLFKPKNFTQRFIYQLDYAIRKFYCNYQIFKITASAVFYINL